MVLLKKRVQFSFNLAFLTGWNLALFFGLISSLGVLFPLQLRAQEAKQSKPISQEAYERAIAEEELFWGDSLLTTVAHRKQNITESANTVYVITREDIEHSGAVTVPELFAFVPGVQLFYRNANEPEIVVRGFPSQFSPKLLVLVDGVSVYTPATAGVAWNRLPLTVESIERVEIIRGPASVFYGANAFSGVINFVTRSPEDFQGTEAMAFGGTLGNYGAAFLGTYRAGPKGYFRFSGNYRQSEGFGDDNGKQQDDEIKTGTVMADGFIDVNEKSKLRLGVWYNRGDASISVTTVSPARDFTFDNLYAMGYFETQLPGNNTFKVLSFFNRDIQTANLTTDTMRYDIEVENLWNYKNKNYLTAGMDYRYNGYKSFDINSLDEFQVLHMFSLFLNDEFYIHDKVILTGGARYEYDSFTKHNWSGRFNISYLPSPNHVIRSSVARAIRTPAFNEDKIDISFDTGEIFLRGIPNPELDPEEIISVELGYLGFFFDRKLKFTFDFFYNDINNFILITPEFIPPRTLQSQYLNVADIKLWGIEYGIKWQIYDWWEVGFNHSYLHQSGFKDIIRSPNHIINVTNRFKTSFGFSADLAFNWTDDYASFDEFQLTTHQVDNNYRLDVRVAQKFLKNRLEFAVVGQGLVDYPRVEFEPTLQTDRRIYGTLTFRQ